MDNRFYTIAENRLIAERTYRLELVSDDPEEEFGGEFVNIALEGFFLRRPLSVCDRSEGRMTLIYKVVGKGTEALSKKDEGERLEVLTGLGKGFDASAAKESALLVGGGLGAAPLYLLCKELISKGVKTTVVLGFNKESEIVLEEEFKSLGAEVAIATMDGSVGVKGFVTDAIKAIEPEYDFFYTCGPMVMMKAVCNTLEGEGEASLEERMGCGFGICVGCTIQTKNGPKRVCKDGPVFKKEEIIW